MASLQPSFGAEVKQTAAVSCDEGELRLVREVKKTACSSQKSFAAEDDATAASSRCAEMFSVDVGPTQFRTGDLCTQDTPFYALWELRAEGATSVMSQSAQRVFFCVRGTGLICR